MNNVPHHHEFPAGHSSADCSPAERAFTRNMRNMCGRPACDCDRSQKSDRQRVPPPPLDGGKSSPDKARALPPGRGPTTGFTTQAAIARQCLDRALRRGCCSRMPPSHSDAEAVRAAAIFLESEVERTRRGCHKNGAALIFERPTGIAFPQSSMLQFVALHSRSSRI
jgi:hypothetical protein